MLLKQQNKIMKEDALELFEAFPKQIRKFTKGQFILFTGTTTQEMGIVLSGSIQIEQNDFWGNRTILDKISEGGFFAETYAITGEPSMVDVEVIADCEIAFINIQKIMSSSDTQVKMKLSQILVNICSKKNLKLSQKIMFTSAKSIRARLNGYLTYQAKLNDSKEFDIPYDRQQLADYLNLDRSAMSGELSQMVKEGLLETRKSHFILKNINK